MCKLSISFLQGHAKAIELFGKVAKLTPGRRLKLVLAGSQMMGKTNIQYTQQLKRLGKGKNIKFLINYSNSELVDLLVSADILWHLTGIDKNHSDPASEEHFGISVALGMSYGVVPVVFNGGAMREIIQHGQNGYICESSACIVKKSLVLIHDKMKRKRAMIAGIQKSKKFSEESFLGTASMIIHRSLLAKPYRFFVNETSSIVNMRKFHLQKSSRKMILLIEPRNHYALEYTLKNALYHLGNEWAASLVHGNLNKDYASYLRNTIFNLHLIHIDIDNVDIPRLNKMLTDRSFWEKFASVEQLLFIQTDGLLIHGRIKPFEIFDFIGAPWHRGNQRWGQLTDVLKEGVGNGGMSLRRPKSLLKVLEQYEGAGQEDLFYVIKMFGDHRFNLPTRQVAYNFAREVPCDDLVQEEVPMMVHAPWYYFPRQSLYQILEKSVCG
jgi:hypothetical protein